MTIKVWVLTSEHNDYDQHGEYFEAVFHKEPTLEVLADYFSGKNSLHFSDPMAAVKFLEHLRKGGGRIKTEDVWYNLSHITCL